MHNEEAIKEQIGEKVRKNGQMFIVKISVHKTDASVKPNGDVVILRIVPPNEIIGMDPA